MIHQIITDSSVEKYQPSLIPFRDDARVANEDVACHALYFQNPRDLRSQNPLPPGEVLTIFLAPIVAYEDAVASVRARL